MSIVKAAGKQSFDINKAKQNFEKVKKFLDNNFQLWYNGYS